MIPRLPSILALSTLALLCGVSLPAAADPGEPAELSQWSPDGEPEEGLRFKAATVCHDNERDLYGIAAVFERFDWYLGGTYDELYYLRIQGDSGSGDYGSVVSEQVLAQARRIDHVDCTTNGNESIFVTYDRQWDNAQWARIDGTDVHGPYDVETGACNPVTHRPRIAFGAEERIIVAVEGYHYDEESSSCEVCAQQYEAYSGDEVPDTETLLWPDAGMTHTDYDVEWGDDAFILAMPHWPDWWADPLYFSTFSIDLENTLDPETVLPPANLIQNFEELPEPGYPQRVKLVRSTNDNNEEGAMFLRTDTGSYWLDGTGALLDAPLDDPTSPQMAVCEYWGADPAVAHVFTEFIGWEYVGTYPHGWFAPYYGAARNHYGLSRDYPYETFDILTGFVPEACDGADTYADPEVVLVSRPAGSSDGFVYWSILPNDD